MLILDNILEEMALYSPLQNARPLYRCYLRYLVP